MNAIINTADEQETEDKVILPPTNPDFHSEGSEAPHNTPPIDEPAHREATKMEDTDITPED